jgi:hypothetical protein
MLVADQLVTADDGLPVYSFTMHYRTSLPDLLEEMP